MNGYQLTRQWFSFRFENSHKVTAAHSEFYFYLLDRWNRFGQKQVFSCPRILTMEVLGIGSHNTYKKIYQDLIAFGFIEEVSKACNRYKECSYVRLSKNDTLSDILSDSLPDNLNDNLSDTTIELKNKGTKEQKKERFDFSKYGNLSDIIQKWVDYKKSIKNSYKSQSSLDIVSKKLNELSGGDYQKAEAIVEQSIANQWQGLFELRQQPTNANRGNSQLPVDPSQIVNYGKGNGTCLFDPKSKLYYEPLLNGHPPKEIIDYAMLDQGNHSNYVEYVRWMLLNGKKPMPPEDTRYLPTDWNFENFVSEQKAILATSNQ
jgi:hypothetical protein